MRGAGSLLVHFLTSFNTSLKSSHEAFGGHLCLNSGKPISHVCNVCLLREMVHQNFDETLENQTLVNPANYDDVVDDCMYEAFSKKGLHFLHLNARSLLSKLSDVRLLVNNSKAAVLAVSETWLDGSVTDAEIELVGYTVVRKDRNRNGGGVCLYVRSDISYNPRTDLLCDELESVWIDLLPMTRPITVGACYRPPTQDNFLDLIEKQLSEVSLDAEILVLGDLNIDLTNKKSNCTLVRKLFSFPRMFALTQIIDCATRITCNSSSIIDLIFTSVMDNITQSGVLEVGISDHLVIYCTRKVTRVKSGCHKCVKVRSLKKYTKDQFNELLMHCGLDCIYDISNVNEAYAFFKDKFVSILLSVYFQVNNSNK